MLTTDDARVYVLVGLVCCQTVFIVSDFPGAAPFTSISLHKGDLGENTGESLSFRVQAEN